MINPSINFQEEFSSKLPALTLLTTLDCYFIPKHLLTGSKHVIFDEGEVA